MKIGDITESALTVGNATQFPAGFTYMWYDPQKDYMYDRSGIIFRVNPEGVVDYIFTFENGDEEGENYQRQDDDFQTGTVYEMSQTTQESSLASMIEYAKFYQIQLNIIKLDSSDESTRIKTIVEGGDFRSYAKSKEMMFVVFTDSTGEWSQNAAKYLKSFQTTPQQKQSEPNKVFEPTSVHGKVPCLMVYEGCSQCTTDGSTIEYQKENYDLTGKDFEYVRQRIEGGE